MIKYIDRQEVIVRESYSMAFKGGEIWFEQLDALSVHTDIVMDKFRKDLSLIKKPSLTGFIAVNVNETLVDAQMADEIIRGFVQIPKIRKVVFIGVTKATRNIMKGLLEQKDRKVSFVYTFIDDYEKAKEWLVVK